MEPDSPDHLRKSSRGGWGRVLSGDGGRREGRWASKARKSGLGMSNVKSLVEAGVFSPHFSKWA